MARWTGWHYDHANDRLGMYYKGHLAAYLNGDGITGVDVDAGFGGGTDLSALASDLLPATDDSYDLGSTSKRWSELHVSDSIMAGDSPATDGLINVPHGRGLRSTQPFDVTNIDLVKVNSSSGFFQLGKSQMGLSVQIMGGVGLQVGDDGENTQLSRTGGNVAWSALGPDTISLYSPQATAIDTAHSVYGFLLWGNYWDGAATQPTYSGLIQQTNAAGAVDTILSAGVYGISEADLHWDKDANLFPDSDNTGSLGKLGATWGAIYANHLTGIEVADPSAPAANSGTMYFRDNGGKTELVARFPTGAIQRLAIEP